MEPLILSVAAVLIACGLYLVLDRTLLRIVIGLGLLSNGTHLLLMATGGLYSGTAPIITGHESSVVDPLPQALILTAIVIAFGVTSLLLTLSYHTFLAYHSDDLGELHGRLDDE